MTQDAMFLAVGEFGRFQVATTVFLTLLGVLGHSDFIGFSLFYTVPEHKCVIPPDLITNSTLDLAASMNRTLDELFQVEPKTDDTLIDQHCEIYTSPYTPDLQTPPSTQTCHEWKFKPGYPFGVTFPVTFDMLCEHAGRRAVGQSLTAVGFLLGATVFGVLSDRVGRVRAMVAAACLKAAFNWLLVFSGNSLLLFYFSYMMCCACHHGTYIVLFVYLIEITGPRMRLFAPALRNMFEVIEDIYCLGFVYVFMDWRYFEMLMGTLGFLMLFALKFCKESPLWLISKERKAEAKQVLMTMSRMNRKTIPQAHLDSFINECLSEERSDGGGASHTPVSDEAALCQSVRSIRQWPSSLACFVRCYPTLCLKSGILFVNWCAVAAGFYAIFFSLPNLGGDKYVNLFLIAVIDYPVYLMCYVGMERFGRKSTFLVSMYLGGFCGLVILGVRHESPGMVTAMSLAGAMCFSSCFTVIYIWSSEIFPTPIRNAGMGLCSVCGRIGMCIVPYFLLLGTAAEALVCMLAILTATLALLLPETNRVPLPQTLVQGEQMTLNLIPGGIARKLRGVFTGYTRERLDDDRDSRDVIAPANIQPIGDLTKPTDDSEVERDLGLGEFADVAMVVPGFDSSTDHQVRI